MSEDHGDLMSRISQLAGQINRHKNQQTVEPAPARNYTAAPGRGRGGAVAVHHNRSLVINNKTTSTKGVANGPAPFTAAAVLDSKPAGGPTTTKEAIKSPPPPAPAAASGWVAKRGAHMQLINASVYDQHVQDRTKAAAKTLTEKIKRKEALEKSKLNRLMQGSQGAGRELEFGGGRYRLAAGGNKLVRVSGNATTSTPKQAVIGGVRYQRSRNGNLWRAGLVRASRKSTEPCKYYSTTGQCKHGLSCPFVHDPNEVAICQRFLTSGTCPDGDMCDLSHDPTPHRVPACHHFVRGNCVNSNCRYAHVRVNPAASVCERFATLGYCPKGAECTERHVFECPTFDKTGVCTNNKCKLQHVEHAGRRRAAAAAAATAAATAEEAKSPNDGSDNSNSNSSDEQDHEDYFQSDVDSDILSDVGFPLGGEELDPQQDFIQF
ncbi:hypothetical protein BZA05DRAFT_423666 [Tricharina praecox]|uniref:uncharacterized protein n=1 Tax=Tricharina praecox TaxID=43433 RepID=UPI00221F3388|nr:uncharacterized protein BZA05DRAFT_423666 [Tricharina praecox]KAI5857642.1 hypothetical protein BZA05DRAFT_423666 [Tricharina praecox]